MSTIQEQSLMETDNVSTSTSSSSSSDTDPDKDLDADEVRLTQMRRRAHNRKAHAQVTTQVAGLQSYDQMVKAHAFQRMKDGMSKILSLHNPVELSSLCGCLELKVQEKGSTSTELILKWLCANKVMEEDKVRKVLNFMWEGALWEYLHSIGHPVYNCRLDPKNTIWELWCEGGLLEDKDNVRGFVPHFVAREVKKRNDWIQSEDIQERLEKLRLAQDKCKEAERKVISEHDYSNILRYFNMMGALRRLENSVREYLISELEISRSRIDSGQDTASMLRQQLTECENLATVVTNTLNEELGQAEYVAEQCIKERLEVERDLQRMDTLLQSYIDTEENRQEPSGGTMRALKMRHIEHSLPGIRILHTKLQRYRNMRDKMDSSHRANARNHIDEIARLTQQVDDLEAEVSELTEYSTKENTRADRAERDLLLCRRKLARTEDKHTLLSKQSWTSGFRAQGKLIKLQRTVDSCRPVLLAGVTHAHPTIVTLSRTLLTTFKLASGLEMDHIYENACMKRQDLLSHAVRKAEIDKFQSIGSAEQAAARARGLKGKMAKKRSSNNSKNSSRASTPSKASRPGTADSVATEKTATSKKKKGSKSSAAAASAKSNKSTGATSKGNAASSKTNASKTGASPSKKSSPSPAKKKK